jgi:thioredoxin reductase (NADPH)
MMVEMVAVHTQPSAKDQNPEAHDVAIVGAGPIGIELAVALKSAGVDYIQFDARQVGYTISWFAPQTRFFSSNDRIAIANTPLQTWDQSKATREEYLAYLRGIVIQHDLRVNTYEPVKRVARDGDGFLLHTHPPAGPALYRVNKLIFATGGTDRPRRLNIPGEDLPHVSHYFKDPHLYFRKRLLVAGGKNSAVEAALRCHHAGAHVSISYRRSQLDPRSIKYWLLPEINGLIAAGEIGGHFNTVPTEITASGVTLAPTNGSSESTHTEPFDFVLLLVGYEADQSLMKQIGIDLLGECQIPRFDPQTMETNIPNLYVAGCAIGGTQDKYKIFLENCHVHVPRIVAAVTGAGLADLPTPEFAQMES